MPGEYCAYCGEEIITEPLMLVECFTCGQFVPCCMFEKCIDQFDCSNCLNGI